MPSTRGLLTTLVITLLATTTVYGSGLIDNPIIGDSITYLDGTDWIATTDINNDPNTHIKIPATVPGDLITDLYNAQLLEDPIYEQNWLMNTTLWNNNTWIYSKIFQISETTYQQLYSTSATTGSTSGSTQELLLVFDGIKMGATIAVNGQIIGTVTDQYLRYSFPLVNKNTNNNNNMKPLLQVGSNIITVTFDPNILVDGRFMACTGG